MKNNYMLVEPHIGLVNEMAKHLMKKNENCDWLTEDDLAGAGYEALLSAARNYDASRNASFKTYATTCIKNAMLAEIRNMFPVKVNDKQHKIGLVRYDGDDKETNRGVEVLEMTKLFCNWELEQRWLLESLMETVTQLPSDERWLLRCYYGFDGEPMTLQGIANILFVSPQAVHKRLNRVHDKLRRLVMDSRPSYRLCA